MASRAPMTIATVCHDRHSFEAHLRKSLDKLSSDVELLLLDNEDNQLTTNIASLYNRLLSSADTDLVALIHPDVSFGEHLPKDILDAVAGLESSGTRWGALGIVGRRHDGGYELSYRATRRTKVCCLDGCCVVTRPSFGLTFDEQNFDEFHCFVEDYCLQCWADEREVAVLPTAARHAGTTYSRRGAGWGKYSFYRRRLGDKWNGRFQTIMA